MLTFGEDFYSWFLFLSTTPSHSHHIFIFQKCFLNYYLVDAFNSSLYIHCLIVLSSQLFLIDNLIHSFSHSFNLHIFLRTIYTASHQRNNDKHDIFLCLQGTYNLVSETSKKSGSITRMYRVTSVAVRPHLAKYFHPRGWGKTW